MKAWLLRLHRWVALVFALPLAFVLGTAVILSFEPWLVTSSIKPGSVTAEKVEALLKQHDPQGKATSISFRAYDRALQIGRGKVVDVDSGAEARSSTLATVLRTARRMHERLLLDLGWLVLASTIAMLGLAAFGVLMGWPRFANTMSGWHKGMGWFLLPLVVLSPLTGVFLATGVTFAPPRAPTPSGPSVTLVNAVRQVGAKHDLSSLVWLRKRRGQMLARVVEGGEYRVYTVSASGTQPTPRNWPRLWHEGNFAGAWSALLNVVTSFAMFGLLVTGLWIWARRKLRRRNRPRRARVQMA